MVIYILLLDIGTSEFKASDFALFGQRIIGVRDTSLDRIELLLRSEKGSTTIHDHLNEAQESQRFCILECLINSVLLNKEFLSHRNISFNVTPDDIVNSNFLDTMSQLLMEVQVGDITIEVIERKLSDLRKRDIFFKNISDLVGAGFSISLDDFGAEASTIGRLRRIYDKGVLQEVKLDMQVFRSLYELFNENSGEYFWKQGKIEFCGKTLEIHRMAKYINFLKRNKIPLVVEGVEDLDQLDFAINVLDADMLQGYHIHKPMLIGDM